MSKYKLTQKTDANGTTQDIVLDASCVDGVVKSVNNQTPDANGNVTVSPSAPSNMVTTDTSQSISGVKTFTNGISVSGRSAGGGDDEGIIVGRAANNYAGVCLGNPSGMRSVFYLTATNKPVWRWNNGSASFDIEHPAKAGTIALTSDLSGKQDTLVSGTNIKTINGNSVLGSGDITLGGSGISIKSQSFTGYTGVFDFVNARPRAILGLELSFTEDQSFSSGYTASISTSSYASISSASASYRLMFESGKTYYFAYQGQEANGFYFASLMRSADRYGIIRLRNATQHYVRLQQFPNVSSSNISISFSFTGLTLSSTTTWTIYYLE